MPHAVYLHSDLTAERGGNLALSRVRPRLKATVADVALAMVLAGSTNVAMLVFGASALSGDGGVTLSGAFTQIWDRLGQGIGLAFALALAVSGLGSAAVGAQAGAVVMAGLVNRSVPALVRRLVTVIPAIAVLVAGFDPITILVMSQVALSLGLPFALVPLLVLTSRRVVMAQHVNQPWLIWLGFLITGLVVALDLTLVFTVLQGG